MVKKIVVAAFLLAACTHDGQKNSEADKSSDDLAITTVLNNQVTAWNKADIDEFMKGYWKSDSILFIGSKITSGWDSTLVRYKKSYPDSNAMGKLRFEIIRIDRVAPDCYLVTGKYFLTRKNDNPSGIFTLLFRKKNDQWVIVYDHTS